MQALAEFVFCIELVIYKIKCRCGRFWSFCGRLLCGYIVGLVIVTSVFKAFGSILVRPIDIKNAHSYDACNDYEQCSL